MNRSHAVVIPCRNEERSIGALVREVRGYIEFVVVVDDGSTDATTAEAEGAGAVVIHNSNPRGKGAALQTGWNWATTQGFQRALCMDGDGQHSPADIPKFLERGAVPPLIIGNRMHAAHQMPVIRRVVNRWMSRRLSRLLGTELPDTQCGFRLINLSFLSRIAIDAQEFEIESELILKFMRAGAKIEFVPIQVIYKNEQSKIRPWRDSCRWIRWYARMNH